ncbi:MAG: SCO family protein [Ignavibacteriaceae bacterium]
MKSKIKTLISGLLVGAITFLLVQFYGCSANTGDQENTDKTAVNINEEKGEKPSCCSSELGEEEYSENSIYQLESEWTNQSGKEINISELKGKPVVFTMFFASCTYACPILINDMKKIEANIPKEDIQNTRFVLVSIDPERDTPAALKEFAKKYSLDLNRWSLLTGSKDNIQELAAVLGFKYKKEENGEYSHSNLINILDEEGEVVYQHTGLNKDIAVASEKLDEQNKF